MNLLSKKRLWLTLQFKGSRMNKKIWGYETERNLYERELSTDLSAWS